MKKFINKINVSARVTEHLVGENHRPIHHRLVGIVIMLLGTLFASGVKEVGGIITHILAEMVGFAIHGIGLIPFIHSMEHKPNLNTEKKTLQHEQD